MIDMASTLHSALCCWASSQQSPVDDSPSSPDSPCSAQSEAECTCARVTSNSNSEKIAVTASTTTNITPASPKSPSSSRTQPHPHCCFHEQLASAQLSLQRTPPSPSDEKHHRSQRKRPPTPTRSWPRTSHIKDVLAKKTSAPSALDVVSPYHSTTFMLTPPSAYSHNYSPYSHHSHHSQQQHSAPGKSPSKRFSLQKYYYGRNTMVSSSASAIARMTPSRTPSPPPLATLPFSSSPSLALASTPAQTTPTPGCIPGSHSIPVSSSLSSPLSLSLSISTFASASATIPERTALVSGCERMAPATETGSMPNQGSNAGSLSILVHRNFSQNSINSSTHRNNDPFVVIPSSSQPSIEINMPSKTWQLSPPKLTAIDSSLSHPSPSSPYASSTPDCNNDSTIISSPEKSTATPFPASSISAAKLAQLIKQSDQGSASAGSRQPLILDLRPHPDFYPLSIAHSININLPTLLMRRYRRGGAVSSFALESFITMPSDKEVYDQIQDSWRANAAASSNKPHDVIVLDQDMGAGGEAYGRSATAAWTLLNVLERGIGSDCFGGAPIRLWYLEGGFAAFQAFDAGETYLTRPGFFKSSASSPDLGPMQQYDQDVEMTAAAPAEFSDVDASLPNYSKPVRRESLFSLNTKVLQRPAGLNRAQTANLKLAIPSLNCSSQQQQQQNKQPQQSKGCWLTVPSSMAAAATSPTMSIISNHSMEITHSASTDHSSSWSADSSSVNGSGHFPSSASAGSMTLSAKRSASSLLTINSAQTSSTSISIQDECEEQSESGSVSRSLRVPYSIQQWDNDSCKSDLSRSRSGSFQSIYSKQYHEDACHPLQYQHYDQQSINGRSSNFDCAEQEEDHNDGEEEISCILPNFLYLGPEIVHQSQVEELDRLGVKRILNMATECEDLLVSNRQGMEYHKIGVYDHIDADVSAGLQEAVDIIAASSDSPIYVHCKAGKSRSVTATIAYLITQLQWPLNKAYQHVLTQRPCMCPNIGFVTELIRMEERTLGADKARGINVA